MNAKLGSDGRLTLSRWLPNQLDSPDFAWRTKKMLFDGKSIRNEKDTAKEKDRAKGKGKEWVF